MTAKGASKDPAGGGNTGNAPRASARGTPVADAGGTGAGAAGPVGGTTGTAAVGTSRPMPRATQGVVTGQTGTNASARPTRDRPFAHLKGADTDENLAKYGTPTEALEEARSFSQRRQAMEIPDPNVDVSAPAPRGRLVSRIPNIDEIRQMSDKQFGEFLKSLPEEDRPRFESIDRS